MKIKEFALKNNFNILTEELDDKNIDNIYVSDLLSYAIANLKEYTLWLTIQEHINIVAVASLKECNAIIIAENNKVESSVIKKAVEEEVILINTDMKIYEICELLTEELKNG